MSWHILNTDPHKSLLEKVLQNRGITDPQQIEYFFNHATHNFHDPFLMKDMEKAVTRIQKAITGQERIVIYGDYDVDGMSGTALLFHALKKLGALISYRIPHRLDDGYGMHKKFIDEFEKINVTLVITVDCGISCATEIAYAAEKKIDVIVSDHHTIPEKMPDAVAILHPLQKDCPYPFKGLTGSGVAFKLAHALLQNTQHAGMIESLTDLASFGTIADLGPLLDENRTIVTRGLHAFRKTKWIGLEYLKKTAQISSDLHPLDTTIVGFKIAPRINAAGRIAHPYIALQLMLQEDPEKARKIVLELEILNNRRREMTGKACEEAEYQVSRARNTSAIVAKSTDWHTGILGLIAARLSEKHQKPAFIFHDRGTFLTASVRSPGAHNVMDMLKKVAPLITTFGGHPQAAGLTVSRENFGKFKETIENMLIPIEGAERKKLELEAEIAPNDLTLKTAETLEKLHPFGIGNEKPVFMIRSVKILEMKIIGKGRDHLKMSLECGEKRIDAVAFGMGDTTIQRGGHVNIAGSLEKNTFNRKTNLQIMVQEMREILD